MRKILFALMGLTLATMIVAEELEHCNRNCGLQFGQCLINKAKNPEKVEGTNYYEVCVNEQHECAQDCIKQQEPQIKFKGVMGACQKNCGIDYSKCLVTTFDIKKCTQNEGACALECLKSPAKVKKSVRYPIDNVQASFGVCEKNCGIDFGKCIITSGGDLKGCLKNQAVCALDCLKTVHSSIAIKTSKSLGVCQKGCAIDYSKCLITTFDMVPCTKTQAACALGCLQEEAEVEEEYEEFEPEVAGLRCTLCKASASAMQPILKTYGCSAAEKACSVFKGFSSTASSVCKGSFSTYCPIFMEWVMNNKFDGEKVCTMMRLC